MSGGAEPTTTAALALRLARLEARVGRLERPAGAAAAPAAEPLPAPPRLRAIIAATAAAFGLPEAEIRSARRQGAPPRHVAMALARRLTGASLPAIGRAFGRDHSTVLYAVRRIAARAAADPAFAARLEAIAAAARRQAAARGGEEVPEQGRISG
ncbi:hypothetical protein GCM10010964_18400 [Caldovatus sediminis]|uniref:Chromosomal replication initiator DnaA C-terminal domain-containing protein n=1 Tax=Caldovatus sediminis TaxID=2041189 RepID=A0A8J2ZBA1_9PROT|nr:helix-turn-helix domain-containing protein [Caldovatus sediminis]GGG30814.1 hypothetical protein GCM10010964_18400 [Caldovatus sediminis]